ncbi:SOS response-associated peptidase [Acidisoma silvae]|uniref:Abasic site processing protein n=1 Tax=Acidisoma silvae TaxID=2802396 RepID=A0A963YY51_9PROT|nr:SOS response-associated peptidase [Acidisoma silvae]MCB8878457.1 SOS response-associated peptidase [Acidisoma silvae]
MCGRYASFRSAEAIKALFRTVNSLPEGARPSWNIAPSQPALVVRRHPETGARHLDQLSWGLVPHWTKDLTAARRPANAWSETIATAAMFRSAFASRRCLVPADAWYEWQATAAGKQPYAFARTDHEPGALAGIWEGWKAEKTGKVLRTFWVITTGANPLAAAVHDRMPVVVAPEDWPLWLGEAEGDTGSLLHPMREDLLETWPTGTAVNKVANNGPKLLVDTASVDHLHPSR